MSVNGLTRVVYNRAQFLILEQGSALNSCEFRVSRERNRPTKKKAHQGKDPGCRQLGSNQFRFWCKKKRGIRKRTKLSGDQKGMLSNNRIGLVVVAVVPWFKIISSSSLLHSPSPRCASTRSLSTPVVSLNTIRSIVRIDVSFRSSHSFSIPPSSSSSSSSSSLASFRRPGEGQQQRKQNRRRRQLAKSLFANSAPTTSTNFKGGTSYYAPSAALFSALCQSSVNLRRPGMGQQEQRNRRNRRSQQQSSLCVEAIASIDDPTTNLNDRKPLHEELHRYGVHESDYTSHHKVEPQEPDSSLNMNKHKTRSSRMPRKRKATPDLAGSSKQQQHPDSKEKSGVMQDWCCYLLLSVDSKKTYVGVTFDIKRRLRQHNGEIAGGAKSARAGRPWRLVCTVRGFNSRSEACQFEWRWKSTAAKIKTIVQQDPETIESPLITRRRATLAKVLESKEEWSFLNVQWHTD